MRAIGHTEWVEDHRFADRSGRQQHHGTVEAALVNWFLERPTDEAVDHLNEAGVPCAPVNTVPQSAVHPHVGARDVMVEVPDPHADSMHVTGRVIKFNRSGMPVGSAPTVGQHTDEILEELLQMDGAKIASLRDAGVV